MRKSKVFNGSEPRLALYSSLISHIHHFWKQSKNQWKKGPRKSCFLIQKRALDAKGSIEGTIFLDFSWFEKSLIFQCHEGASKNPQKSSPGASKGRHGAATRARWHQFWRRLPQGRPPRAYYQNINTGIIKNRFENTGFIKTGYKKSESGSNTPMGRWPGDFFSFFNYTRGGEGLIAKLV